MPFFSVIIPIYNTENYLKRCLDSVTKNSFKDIEILLINDGSTDNSLKIAQDYAQNDARIKLFSQENKGQSHARNLGIDNANGEFIVFVDSDDFIDLDMFKNCHRVLSKNTNLDILMININFWWDRLDNKKRAKLCRNYQFIFPQNQPLSMQDFFSIFEREYRYNDLFITTTAHYLIKNKLLKDTGLRFLNNLWFEDVLFCTRAFMLSKSIYITTDAPYYYVQSTNSTMRQKRTKDVKIKSANDFFTIAKALYSDMLNEPDPIRKQVYRSGIRMALKACLNQIKLIGYAKGINFSSKDWLELEVGFGSLRKLSAKYPRTTYFIYPAGAIYIKFKHKYLSLLRLIKRIKKRNARLKALKNKAS
ncbi:MAG: glycosyltransferase [Helicobacter sp.]|nr:glycosyltransferase [Helicobacter sp.]